MSDDDDKSITRRNFLKASVMFSGTLALSGCTGIFSLRTYNNSCSYDNYSSTEDIRKINFAYLNAADLRGNTDNIWAIISRDKALFRAKYLAKIMHDNDIDVLCLSEVDYKGTAKTGGLNQPETIAKALGHPYNYAVFDQYFKSAAWTTGNAVISRHPMKALHRHIFGTRYGIFGRLRHVFKDFIHVSIKVGKRRLDTIVNHFDDSFIDIRMEEVKDLMDYVSRLYYSDPERYIVSPGDYNSRHSSKPIRKILSYNILHAPPKNFGMYTYQAHKPVKDIDHIFATENLSITNYRTFHYPYSDHLGLMCTLEFKDA
ncbi:hypothetical protein D6777_03585 [Candidatus Woesearchaeota archaeon]|nr:MAG: hypothetical protein D6777_03585 [Candidatus Woesearchaeota archaeon]